MVVCVQRVAGPFGADKINKVCRCDVRIVAKLQEVCSIEQELRSYGRAEQEITADDGALKHILLGSHHSTEAAHYQLSRPLDCHNSELQGYEFTASL